MKSFTTISAALLCLLTLSQGSPIAESLPEGWEPISSEEIHARLADPNHNLQKRTPGGVKTPRSSLNTRVL